MDSDIVFRPATLAEIIGLRHAVLRPRRARQTAIFNGDDHAQTRHFAAFAAGRSVCCLTVHASQWESRPAWQLRGMATDPEYAGKGLGRGLLQYAEKALSGESPIRMMWCNARMSAVEFYLKQGWRVVSEVFDVPDVGPHVRMLKEYCTI